MDMTLIISVITAIIITAVFTYFIVSRKQSASLGYNTTDKAPAPIQNFKEKNELAEKYEELSARSKAKIDSLTKEITDLNNQLSEVASGNTDVAVKKQLDSIKNLKKEIEDLEDELDEKDDDLKDLKKKLNKKDEENANLQDQLRKIEKETKLLHENLERLDEDLKEKEQELNLKSESINFVQEILSAKRVNDENTRNLYTTVDNIVNYVKGELRDNFKDELDSDSKSLFAESLDKWAAQAKKSWIQHKVAIAFVGEFSAGKTSIVNRILSQDDERVPRLPVSTKATTAIPTYISGGVGTSYNFITPDNIQKYISEDTFKRVNKEVLDQIDGVSSLIQYFVMTYKNENLNRLSILDTPGFNSNDKEDAERTIGVINECDALFWVFDVNAGTVNRSSIKLIKDNLKKPLYVVINKVDTKAKSEVDKVEKLIRKTLQESSIQVEQFIRFSGKEPLETIMKPIKNVTGDDEESLYLERLLDFVNSIDEYYAEAANIANKDQNDLAAELDEIRANYEEYLGTLIDHCEKAGEIPHKKSGWFRGDRYEMSMGEHVYFSDLLTDIVGEDSANINAAVEDYSKKQVLWHNAFEDYKDKAQQSRIINQCIEILRKKISKYKKDYE